MLRCPVSMADADQTGIAGLMYNKLAFNGHIDIWGWMPADRPTCDAKYPDMGDGDLECYGVVDSPQQFYERFGKQLEADPRMLCVLFTHVEKSSDPEATHGWRWHKWGVYYGTGTPTQEYLDDEDAFNDGVYVFHIYDVSNVPLVPVDGEPVIDDKQSATSTNTPDRVQQILAAIGAE